MRIHRPLDTPIRTNAPWTELWDGPDRGLIAAWERGREKRREDPGLVQQAQAGQLMPLPWKGGVEKQTQKKQKMGAMLEQLKQGQAQQQQ